MRTIKFRGKRVDNGEWVYGYYAKWQGDYVLFPLDTMGRLQKVTPSTIGQFTGLQDKNGKDIYEGDVLSKDPLLKVVFENGGFCFANDLYSGSDRLSQDRVGRLEIIGNIHDNPELFNQSK